MLFSRASALSSAHVGAGKRCTVSSRSRCSVRANSLGASSEKRPQPGAAPTPRPAAPAPRPSLAPPQATSSHAASISKLAAMPGLPTLWEPPHSALAAKKSTGGLISVRFKLRYSTNWGEGVKVIGSCPNLGNWSVIDAPELHYTHGDVWAADILLPPGVIEYKYVIINYHTKHPINWQYGGNAVLALDPKDAGPFEVEDNWGNAPGAGIKGADGTSLTRENKLKEWGDSMMKVFYECEDIKQELVMKSKETNALKSELTQVKMELTIAKQASDEMATQIQDLKSDCLKMKMELTSSQIEMNNTLSEILGMLQHEMQKDFAIEGDAEEEDMEYEYEEADEEAEGEAEIDDEVELEVTEALGSSDASKSRTEEVLWSKGSQAASPTTEEVKVTRTVDVSSLN